MIICQYKDGSSIRIYKTNQARNLAMANFKKNKTKAKGYYLTILASYPNHYSLKIMPITSPTFFDHVKRF